MPHYISGGINLYVFADDSQAPTGGHSFCTPNDYCFVAGKSQNSPRSKTQLVSHEIGHCLGLLHTHHDHGCVDIGGPNCGQVGDLVCDTPPDDGQYGSPTECSTLPLYNNIMSYFPILTCTDRFTPGQGERMRHYLKNGLGVLSQVKMQDIFITGNTTWDTPTDVPANVFIEPGAVLNVHAPVTMREDAFIYIKANHEINNSTPGAQLRVHDLITASCPNQFWQGVIVDGDANQAQSTQKQGKLTVLTGGIIEHARIGARVQGHDFEDGEPQGFAVGGIVISLLGEFRNNLVDVQFAPYAGQNTSLFLHSKFVTTDDYRGSATEPPLHVRMDGVKNIRLMNCHYKDLRTGTYADPGTRGRGIDALNATFSVSGTSVFANLFEGARIGEISPLSSNSVSGATFESCFTGIFSCDNHNYTFNGNTFHLQRPANYTNPAPTEIKSIYMEGMTNAFMVSGNNFVTTDFSLNDYYIGTDALSVTKKNNNISNNYYERLHIANRANGQNAVGAELLFSGLMYECNIYEGNLEHDHLVPSGAIRKEQGSRNQQIPTFPRISSGNRYNEVFGFTLAQQFTNQGTGIDYHHRENTPEEILDGFFSPTTIIRQESVANPNCGTGGEPGCPNPPCPQTFISTIKTQFFQEKQQWATKLTAFPNITNTQEQQAEAKAINTLRLSLDRKGNTILLHHALDTTGIQADSILLWLEHLDTYDADLQLARHHFFSGNYAAADNLLQIIPARYDLSGDLLAEFNDIVSVLQTIRPSLEAEILIGTLPKSVLETLESAWGTDCSAAGALARSLLYQNGIRLYADCDGTQERPSRSRQGKPEIASGMSLKIYPNPAVDELTIEIPPNTSCFSVDIFGLVDNRLSHHIEMSSSKIFKINTSDLPSGMYAVVARLVDGATLQTKFLVAH
ncbi:MAG: T9SS type A sorting domain-containing protein [Saprospiraceae bacterium]